MQLPARIDADTHPAIVEVAAIVGRDAALRLVSDFGGRTLYIPRHPGPHHPLVVSIGEELAKMLAEYRHATTLELPVANNKRRRIVELDEKGWTRFAIAREVGLTERRVYQVLAEHRGTHDQPALFS